MRRRVVQNYYELLSANVRYEPSPRMAKRYWIGLVGRGSHNRSLSLLTLNMSYMRSLVLGGKRFSTTNDWNATWRASCHRYSRLVYRRHSTVANNASIQRQSYITDEFRFGRGPLETRSRLSDFLKLLGFTDSSRFDHP